MRKMLWVVSVALFVLYGSVVAEAGTYCYQPDPANLYNLDHNMAYAWGIKPIIQADEEIIGAQVFFDNIRNWDSHSNDLWLNLLNTPTQTGVKSYTDNSANGNYFESWDHILLNHYKNLPATAQDITYDLSDPQVKILIDYITNDGLVGLGFDPDCHFYNDGISFCIETNTPPDEPPGEPPDDTIPEPASGLLFLLGLSALKRRRRT